MDGRRALARDDAGLSQLHFDRNNGQTAKDRALIGKRNAKRHAKEIGSEKSDAPTVTPASRDRNH